VPVLRKLSLMTVLVVVIAACGGGSDPGTTTPGGTQPGPTTTAGPGGTPAPTTTPRPGGDDVGSVTVEIDGETYELSLRKDIQSQVPGYMHQTECRNASGEFVVVAVATGDDGTELIPGYSLRVDLTANGSGDRFASGFEFKDDGNSIEYLLIEDDPGSWTITGNRLQGELNVKYFDGENHETTARIDANCPGYEG